MKTSRVQKGCRGQMRVDTPAATTLTTADQYYQVAGTFVDTYNKNFTTSAAGAITYTGTSGLYFQFSGASNLIADKACKITFALYLNGALATGAESPVDIAAATKNNTNAITRILQLNNGDILTVWVKSDTNTTSMTANTLFITVAELA